MYIKSWNRQHQKSRRLPLEVRCTDLETGRLCICSPLPATGEPSFGLTSCATSDTPTFMSRVACSRNVPPTIVTKPHI